MKKSPVFLKKLIRIALISIAAMAAWIYRSPISQFLDWINDREALTAAFRDFGIWGPVVLFALMVMQVFLAVIPGHALILAGAYVYGFWTSVFVTLTSTVLGSQIAFSIARHYGRDTVYRLSNPKVLQKWDRVSSQQGALFYFFAFVLPIFPSDLMCYVAGLGKVSPRGFLVANVLGRLVCAVFITLIGSNGLRMPVMFWVAALLVIAGLYTAWLVYSRRQDLSLDYAATGSEIGG